MANYREIARHFPEVRDYLRHRRWVRRGDVLAYAPRVTTSTFSTDAFGFRHTVFEDTKLGLEATEQLGRYGLLLGSSHVFGFGLPGNQATIASQLSKLCGFPVLSIVYPEADSRTLHSTLLRTLSGARHPPVLVVLLSGGDFTRFCFTGNCDPLFGPPDFERPSASIPDAQSAESDFRRLCFFTSFWTDQIVKAARDAGARVVIGQEPTVFEKSELTETEARSELGQDSRSSRFALHRHFISRYHQLRSQIAGRHTGVGDWTDLTDAITYIDEFHYTADGVGRLAARIAREAALDG